MTNLTLSTFRVVGSLFFAAILLVSLMVAMACATVYESMHGTEQALGTFYHSWGFKALLGLIGLNILASLVSRFPFHKRQIGFVLTHGGILVILLGAVVTDRYAINGQVGIVEGQSVRSFTIPEDTLTVVNRRTRARTVVDLDDPALGGFEVADNLTLRELSLGDLVVKVERYLPDMSWQRSVLNDSLQPNPAVEVAIISASGEQPVWLFLDQTTPLASTSATLRQINDADLFSRLVSGESDPTSDSTGTVLVEFKEETIELPVETCKDRPMPLGNTGRSIRVLRYLPHAVVGGDNQVTSASDRPVNPAIEVEITGPDGSQKRLAFAKFPDFSSTGGHAQSDDMKIIFKQAAVTEPTAPVEVIQGPTGNLYGRFTWAGAPPLVHRLLPGVPVDTPWPDMKFKMIRHFDRARVEWLAEPVEPVRNQREPAVLLKLTAGEATSEVWVQKQRPRAVALAGESYEFTYSEKVVPLNFNLGLKDFQVGYHPGTRRPRSFQSSVTITDPTTGQQMDRIISMNNPTKYGGFTFYQSSYRQEAGRAISFLSVSRDPGKWVAFIGYIAAIVGMITVLTQRMIERRHAV